jgi:hypothetical protein
MVHCQGSLYHLPQELVPDVFTQVVIELKSAALLPGSGASDGLSSVAIGGISAAAAALGLVAALGAPPHHCCIGPSLSQSISSPQRSAVLLVCSLSCVYVQYTDQCATACCVTGDSQFPAHPSAALIATLRWRRRRRRRRDVQAGPVAAKGLGKGSSPPSRGDSAQPECSSDSSPWAAPAQGA